MDLSLTTARLAIVPIVRTAAHAPLLHCWLRAGEVLASVTDRRESYSDRRCGCPARLHTLSPGRRIRIAHAQGGLPRGSHDPHQEDAEYLPTYLPRRRQTTGHYRRVALAVRRLPTSGIAEELMDAAAISAGRVVQAARELLGTCGAAELRSPPGLDSAPDTPAAECPGG